MKTLVGFGNMRTWKAKWKKGTKRATEGSKQTVTISLLYVSNVNKTGLGCSRFLLQDLLLGALTEHARYKVIVTCNNILFSVLSLLDFRDASV